jgi:hypothetical protein
LFTRYFLFLVVVVVVVVFVFLHLFLKGKKLQKYNFIKKMRREEEGKKEWV